VERVDFGGDAMLLPIDKYGTRRRTKLLAQLFVTDIGCQL
jgi:hypothetical protein